MLVYGVSWLFIVAGLGFLLYALLVRGVEGVAAQRLTSAEDPLTVLKSRYARGEITRDQFLTMQRDLSDDMGGIRK